MHAAIVICALVAVLLILVAAGVELGWFRPSPPKPPHHWVPPGSPGTRCGPSGACPGGQICVAGKCLPAPPKGACADVSGPPGPPGRRQLDAKALPLLSYFQALYPQGNTPQGLLSLTAPQLLQLYNSLKWYYLPLVSPIDPARRSGGSDGKGVYPIKGPWIDAETQWFLADGADCGDPVPPDDPGTFTCSVFGGACTTSEWGGASGGGRPYQYISFIKPYGRRGGSPNYAYIECVAFVCEALGRQLLTAGDAWGDKECSYAAPSWQDFLDNPQAGKVANWNRKGSFTGGPWAADGDPEGADDDHLHERESWIAAPGAPYAEAFGGPGPEAPPPYRGGPGIANANTPPWHHPSGLRRGGTAADTHGVLGIDIAAAGPPSGAPPGPGGPFGTPYEGWRAQAAPTGLGGVPGAPLAGGLRAAPGERGLPRGAVPGEELPEPDGLRGKGRPRGE